jgi:hypothetical protein
LIYPVTGINQLKSKCQYFTIVSEFPNHSGDMPEGTLRAILKESGISPDEFLRKS